MLGNKTHSFTIPLSHYIKEEINVTYSVWLCFFHHLCTSIPNRIRNFNFFIKFYCEKESDKECINFNIKSIIKILRAAYYHKTLRYVTGRFWHYDYISFEEKIKCKNFHVSCSFFNMFTFYPHT